MENKSHALLAGAFTIVLLTAAILVWLWLDRDRVQWVPYQIATRMSVPGLSPQAAVRYRGLDVGKVVDIDFDPQVPGQILIRLNVQPETPITESTFATLGYQGVTGIAYIQLDDDGERPVRLSSSAQQPARIDMRPSLFDQLQTRGLAILEKTEQMTDRINDFLQESNQQAIVGAFRSVQNAAEQVATIPRQLQPALNRVPALTVQTEQALAAVQKLSTSLDSLANKLQAPDGPLTQIGNSAEQIGAAAARLEQDALPLASDARTSLRAIQRTLDNISENPQSLLLGAPAMAPGPGENGFTAPASAASE